MSAIERFCFPRWIAMVTSTTEIATMMPMIATTIKSSISVKPEDPVRRVFNRASFRSVPPVRNQDPCLGPRPGPRIARTRDSEAAVFVRAVPGGRARRVRDAEAPPRGGLGVDLGTGRRAPYLGRRPVPDARPGRAHEARRRELLRGAPSLPSDPPAQPPRARRVRDVPARP